MACFGRKPRQLKGTVERDFAPPFFFIKSTHRAPWFISYFFLFAFKFVELFELKFDSPLHDAAGSQISPLQCAAGSQILPLHFAAGSQISPLQCAAGSQILPMHFAAGSQISPVHDASGRQIFMLHYAAGSQISPLQLLQTWTTSSASTFSNWNFFKILYVYISCKIY